ncbi:hypothetical protein D3C71_809680 [compost metagenome]
MDSTDVPEPADDFVERVLIRWGLLGFVIGFGAVNAAIFFLWRYALSLFYPGA